MKLDKFSIDGKKDSIEVLDKIFSAKVNNKLLAVYFIKQTQIIKVDMLRQSNKTKLEVQLLKFMLKKELVELGTQVEKLQFL